MALWHVHAHRRDRLQRAESRVVHELEVGPLQRLGDIEAGLGQVDAEVARRMRRGGLPRERVLAISVGPQIRGLPLGGRGVEGGVLAASGAAELAVRDQGLMVAVGRGLIDLGPVVEGLRVGLPGGGAHWCTAVAVEALPDSRGGQREGAMGLGGCGDHHPGEGGRHGGQRSQECQGSAWADHDASVCDVARWGDAAATPFG